MFDSARWAIRVALQLSVARPEALRAHRVTTVTVLGDFQAAIRLMAHLDPGPGQQLARAMNKHQRTFCAHTIEAAIHVVPQHLGIPGNKEADHLANTRREHRANTQHEQICNLARNGARQIWTGRRAAQVKCEADNCSKYYGYRLKGKAGRKRSVPPTHMTSRATRFCWLMCTDALTESYLKQCRHQVDDKY